MILRARNLLHTRALHIDLQACTATLTAELAARRSAEERRERDHRNHEVRIDQILAHGEYHMEFQPVTDLATGHTVGPKHSPASTTNPTSPRTSGSTRPERSDAA